jgi:predicted nucleic acid-binding protein
MQVPRWRAFFGRLTRNVHLGVRRRSNRQVRITTKGAGGTPCARRQARLRQVEAIFEPLPFDAIAARSYGQIVAAIAETGRAHRRRVADLLIAATAHASGLTLYTRDPADFAELSDLVDVIGI